METETGAPSVIGRYAIPRVVPDSYPATAALRLRYEAYRERQGRDLLVLLPREGVRALVRRLREREPDGEVTLDRLASIAVDLLPLPPFRVWMEDFHHNRSAHFEISEPPMGDGPSSPDGEPVTVEVRSFSVGSDEWVASLCVHPVACGWHGSIHFHRPPERHTVRTADVFREREADAVRERFRTFDAHTLEAFLRSALP
jgi:hypothetical protein